MMLSNSQLKKNQEQHPKSSLKGLKGQMGFQSSQNFKWDVNVGSLISANFATAAVLISFGIVLGITSSL